MKRLAWMLVPALLGAGAPGLAYDGPGAALVYDQTLSYIRVVLTAQPRVLEAGYVRFTFKAFVPVQADTVGQVVDLQIRKYVPGDPEGVVITSCQRVPSAGDVGDTVEYTCGADEPTDVLFWQIPGALAPGTTVGVYPYVERGSSEAGAEAIHDGRDARLTLAVDGDDSYEPNDSQVSATLLPSPVNPVTVNNLVFQSDPTKIEYDWYKFVVPPGGGSAEVRIRFWNAAGDLDLWVYAPDGSTYGSPTVNDEEVLFLPVVAGETYYIQVELFERGPLYYDLSVTVDAPDIVTITSGPTGSPNPVASGGSAALSVTATDSLGHDLTYFWEQTCSPLLSGLGTFTDPSNPGGNGRIVPNPVWIAPANPTTTMRSCNIKVTVSDERSAATTVVATFTQNVRPAGDALTIAVPPSGTPNPVLPGGTVALSVTASDVLGHSLSYEWVATCPVVLGGSGSFAPSNTERNPSWTPPVNMNGTAQVCTITVTVNDGQGLSVTAGYPQQVDPMPDVVTITTPPSGNPNPVASGATAQLGVTASDSLGHQVSYAWAATCPAALGGHGGFSDAAIRTPVWTAPVNATGAPQGCTLTVTASDTRGQTANASFTQTVNSVPHTVTITAGPSGTPDPVASGRTVALSVTAVDSIAGHTPT
jgi:hypothetical protein